MSRRGDGVPESKFLIRVAPSDPMKVTPFYPDANKATLSTSQTS